MQYLNRERLEAVSVEGFRNRQPYPWINIEESLTPEGYECLRQTLPEVSSFERQVGIKRGYGQGPHDRYLLHYLPGLGVAEPWKEFIAELQGDVYQSFLRRTLGPRTFIPTFEWYYAWEGCAVSPHCDAARKLATHIFYFNTDADWDAKWGGEILILDSGRRFRTHSAPSFDDLKVAAALEPRGNGSLLFQRTPHSWHGVRPLHCPPGNLRKLFLITINVPSIQVWWRHLRGKDPDGYPIHAN
ncbi:MAG TPA: 2OG-Fe(II) oxygenase [Methylomirabilota bacterium]|nr:2OG-Fe(II) oxygenase [Methylomirabilota bacterium]